LLKLSKDLVDELLVFLLSTLSKVELAARCFSRAIPIRQVIDDELDNCRRMSI
jgi:hypothetical protein